MLLVSCVVRYKPKTTPSLWVIQLWKHSMSYLHSHQDILSSNRKQHAAGQPQLFYFRLSKEPQYKKIVSLINPKVIQYYFLSNNILTLLLDFLGILFFDLISMSAGCGNRQLFANTVTTATLWGGNMSNTVWVTLCLLWSFVPKWPYLLINAGLIKLA